MPKSKQRRRSHQRGHRDHQRDIKWGGMAAKSATAWDRFIIPGVFVIALIVISAIAWRATTAGRAFDALADDGRPALRRVVTEPNLGSEHLEPGETISYPARYPTSGDHAPVPTPPGIYTTPQPPVDLVHALEHGNIVIYIGRPRDEDLAVMTEWAERWDGQWDGIVINPDPGLGRSIVLTAWRRRLQLDDFDAAAVAAFIDAYRGRGPENAVR